MRATSALCDLGASGDDRPPWPLTALPGGAGSTSDAAADAERALVDALLRNDAQAWREFNARYARLIYRCITRVTVRFSGLVGPDDVREIYATCCLQLLANDKHKLRSFEVGRGSKLGTWVGLMAIHTTYDYLRTLRREPKRGPLDEAEQLRCEQPDPFDACVAHQRAHRIATALADFSEKDQEFIALYYGEGLAPEAVAQRLGISVKTVYSKHHKIRTRLEQLLRPTEAAA